MQVKKDDVYGYYINSNKLLCPSCFEADAESNKGEEIELLSREEIEVSEDIYVCDGCKKMIKA